MKRVAIIALSLLLSANLGADAHAEDQAAHLSIGDPARKDREVPVILDGITDAARGDTIGPSELAARLDGVKLVFVGENHTEMEFHRVQLRVLQELQRRGRKVLVGLEMYPVPEQKWLDRWYSDRGLTEEQFLAESHWYGSWGYNWNYYRDIFLFAREHDIRMFAVNLPRAAVGVVRAKGFDSLTTEQRAMLPPTVDLENAAHRQLFRAFFGDEDALHGNMPPAMFEAMFRAQCAWDAAMGWNSVKALEKYGDGQSIMVVLIGSGHVAYGLGAEWQAKRWFQGRTASVVPIAIADEPNGKILSSVRASYADFVWGLPPATDPIYPATGISTPEAKSGERYKVINVATESPAEAAGIKTGDELVSIDAMPLVDKEAFNRYMSTKRWGDALAYRVLRDGKELALTVHLRRTPPKPAAADSLATGGKAPEAPAHPAMPAMPSMPPMPPKPAGGGGK